MELRGRGWGVSAAAREVGVSRTAANNWAFGHKVYRKGQVVGAVTPVDRLAVREISARYLSQDERIKIADLHQRGLGVREIATGVGRAPSTVSRELRRNDSKDGYRPFEAHRKATARRRKSRRCWRKAWARTSSRKSSANIAKATFVTASATSRAPANC